MPQIYSTLQAAQRLGIHHYSVCRIIRQGKLRAQKVGRTWVIAEDDLNNLVKCYEPGKGRPRKSR